MSWVAPRVAAVGDVFTAAWVNEISGDLSYLRGDAGGVTLIAQVSGGTQMRAHRHPYGNDRHIESGIVTTSGGVAAVSFTSAFSSTPAVVATIVGSAGSVGNYAATQGASTTGVTLLAISTSSGNASGTFSIHWHAEGN